MGQQFGTPIWLWSDRLRRPFFPIQGRGLRGNSIRSATQPPYLERSLYHGLLIIHVNLERMPRQVLTNAWHGVT